MAAVWGQQISHAADFTEILRVTSMPATSMAFGSALACLGRQPSERLQARLQHFSAGLLLGVVVTDIFPILRFHLIPNDGISIRWLSLLSAILGFALSLSLMYSLKNLRFVASSDADDMIHNSASQDRPFGNTFTQPLLPAAETDAVGWFGKQPGEDEMARLRMALARLHAHAAALVRLVRESDIDREAVDEEVHGIDFLLDSARRLCRGADPMDLRDVTRLRYHIATLTEDVKQLASLSADSDGMKVMDSGLSRIALIVRRIHSHAEHATFRRWGHLPLASADGSEAALASKARTPSSVPIGLVVAVVFDSAVDGMLIGLAGAVSGNASWLLGIATAIEMGFLGYSFAFMLANSQALTNRTWSCILLALPPLAMLCVSVTSFLTASPVQRTPLFGGLIAFALAAVLFLILQELIFEAHDKETAEGWHVSIFLYVGLMLSICMDVLKTT